MLEIQEIIKRCDVSSGWLKPFVCNASDGLQYYVKGANATGDGLIYEWICANLAIAFGLPIPAPVILYLDPSLAKISPTEWQDDLKLEHYFGSQSMSPCDVINYQDVAKVPPQLQKDVFVFDYWIQHNDRQLTVKGGNPNVLWDPNQKEIHIIDHNLAFADDFSVENLLDYHVFAAKFKEKPIDLVDKPHYQDKFSNTLQRFDSCVDELPDEWADDNPELLKAKVKAIKDKLLQYTQDEFWEALT